MKKLYFLLSLYIVFCWSCSVDETRYTEDCTLPSSYSQIVLSPEEWISIAFDNPKNIHQDSITNIITKFINQKYVSPSHKTMEMLSITSIRKVKNYKLTDRITCSLNSNHNLLQSNLDCDISEFELSYNGTNYRIIISTDERCPKVIAFLEIPEEQDGSRIRTDDSPLDSAFASPLMLAYEALYNHLHEVESIRATLREHTLLKISKSLHKPIEKISYDGIKNNIVIKDSDNASTKASAIEFPNGQILSGCWPLIDISWGGDSITSKYMPYYWGTSRVTPTFGLTSVIYILSVIRPAITIPAKLYEGHGLKTQLHVNWNLLTQTEHLLSTDSKTKKEMAGRLYRFINDNSNLEYEGLSFNSYRIINSNINTFRTVLQKYIDCGNVSSYNLTTILNSLGRACPVFISVTEGWGDMFVADGYLKTKSSYGISTYLHLKLPNNLAYSNAFTGYYLVNSDSSLDMEFDNNCVSYSRNFKILPECKHK